MAPLVSVIIPCYNNAAMLSSAITSVLTQDYANIEVIVIDDGSTDDSISVLSQFGDKITLIQQTNQGPAAARNAGLQAAAGEYIAFNDSDDLWLPGKLTEQVSYLQQHPNVGLCYCGWTEWDGTTALANVTANLVDVAPVIAPKQPGSEGWLYLDLLKESVIHTITAVLRREVIDNVGMFNTDYRIGEDHDFWLRVSQKYRIAKLNRVYALYRNNPASITKKVQDKNYSLLVLESAVAHYGIASPCGEKIAPKTLNTYLGDRHFNYGYNAMLGGKPDKAKVSFTGCIRHKYKLPKAIAFWLICSIAPLYNMFLQRKFKQKADR
ncbi:hypothetical protein GCM10027181_30980 [Rheinheimera gaetbuli]